MIARLFNKRVFMRYDNINHKINLNLFKFTFDLLNKQSSRFVIDIIICAIIEIFYRKSFASIDTHSNKKHFFKLFNLKIICFVLIIITHVIQK